jgi:hypothetical protein
MNQIIDPLSIIHFLQYFIFGIFFKNKFILVIISSFAWEIFEYYFIRNKIIKNFLIKYWPIPQKYWEEKNIINRIFDIKFNLLGYFIGNKINYKK